ncbi:MAG TPA: hypothetical protein VE954_05745 [Oligoflexus sp.]|uniref:hypothetical protein n=1 Tax=Oligoflexus sp. TaxID=1971216 RepID=UPI002D35EEEC|nr:hypothetical protein [Oligoflexus sp.]HYX32595.1 hypothetical protein [Oligoflexus sp.]
MKSYDEQLANVQQAIHEIETNGAECEIEVNGNRRRVRRGDLATLYKREAWLIRAIHRESGCGYTPITPI